MTNRFFCSGNSRTRIGDFEAHTRGIGRRLLEARGWKDGQGLGQSGQGMSLALESTWKHPSDKAGIGFVLIATFLLFGGERGAITS